jgi:hypothetical protein
MAMAKKTLLGREYEFPEGVMIHVKTGRHYAVLFPCMIEATLTPAVAYSALGGDGTVWIRPMDEFMDGRFAPVV